MRISAAARMAALAAFTAFWGPTAYAGVPEGWNDAVAKYEAAIAAASSAAQAKRIVSPFVKYQKSLRALALQHGNAPAAAGSLVGIARFTTDPHERLQALVRLRENHMRSRHLGALLPSLVRWGDADALRTLRDIIDHSSHKDLVAAAHAAQYEIRAMGLGSHAPRKLGDDIKDRLIDAKAFAGRALIVIVAPSAARAKSQTLAAEKELARWPDAPYRVFSVSPPKTPDKRWTQTSVAFAARRFNALTRCRVFVYDKTHKLVAKDPYPQDLRTLLHKLFADTTKG